MDELTSTPLGGSPIGDLLSSGTKADLLVLFHRNPGLVDTRDGIARRIGKKGDAITAEISELQSASILIMRKVGKSQVYSLNSKKDQEKQKEIADYISGLAGKSKG